MCSMSMITAVARSAVAGSSSYVLWLTCARARGGHASSTVEGVTKAGPRLERRQTYYVVASKASPAFRFLSIAL